MDGVAAKDRPGFQSRRRTVAPTKREPALWREAADLPVEEWKRYQRELRSRVRLEPLRVPPGQPVLEDGLPRFLAGVDCAFSPDREDVLCVALVWDRAAGIIVERRGVRRRCEAPYVPGFLSFREGPAVEEALQSLTHGYGAVLFDAHGLAHPRGCGLATHVAVELDLVGVGVAKSLLCGRHDEPGPAPGAAVDLNFRGETVGKVLRTKANVRPVFVSVGNRATLDDALRLTMACVTKYRLPEPTRLADATVAEFKAGLVPAPSTRSLDE